MEVAIGVDPAKSSLAVAAVDPLGRVLGAAEFSNEPRGHQALLGWVREHGSDRVIGIECSLSFGATLSAFTNEGSAERIFGALGGEWNRRRSHPLEAIYTT